ncbi:MAG: hypothetical protein ACI4NM_02005 [Bullifex sp.]
MSKVFPSMTEKISFSMPVRLCGRKMTEGYIAVSFLSVYFYACRIPPSCRSGKRCISIPYGYSFSAEAVKEGARAFLAGLN